MKLKLFYVALIFLWVFAFLGCSPRQTVVGLWVNPNGYTESQSWLQIRAEGWESGERGGENNWWEINEEGKLCLNWICQSYSINDEELILEIPNKTPQRYKRVQPGDIRLGQPEQLVGNWRGVGNASGVEFDFLPDGQMAISSIDGYIGDDGNWGGNSDFICLVFFDFGLQEVDAETAEETLLKIGECGPYSVDQGYFTFNLPDEEIRLRKNE